MDYSVIWTEKALDDLKALDDYISEDDSEAAIAVGGEIFRRVELLRNFPDLGPRFPKYDGKYREVICFSYQIFYKVNRSDRLIEIMRIWHGSRDPNNLEL